MMIKVQLQGLLPHLEFDDENAGETVRCPHCGKDTTLFVPRVRPAAPPMRVLC